MDMEKLKLRFGDAALHVCDIMLKDLADSKRINNRIQSECQVGIESMIQYSVLRFTSAVFQLLVAPQAEDPVTSVLACYQGTEVPSAKETAEVRISRINPPDLRLSLICVYLSRFRIQENYGHAYHKFRQDKKLKFYHQGTVVISVRLGDRELELEVTLLQAAVLEAFSKKSKRAPILAFKVKWLTKQLRIHRSSHSGDANEKVATQG